MPHLVYAAVGVVTLERRRLGDSELEVSELSLGSWRTYERISREAGVTVMRTAREAGINFLDDARYDDETGTAPVKTGFSEIVFGDLFRASGWKRHEVVLANKLWWEFWPEQSAEAELDASLQRMGMDYLDLAYSERPPPGLAVQEIVRQVTKLMKTGKLRAWGVLNWPAALIAEAAGAASAQGVSGPCAAQLPYSLVTRSPVEDPEMVHALSSAHVGVVSSHTLVGGALSGKYDQPGAKGRIADAVDAADYSAALRAGSELSKFAGEHGARPAPMAIAFALLNPAVATVLLGATNADQLTENLAGVELKTRMDAETIASLKRIAAP
jgi:aryl-alcohol dehydrogenase-like predicted oxidoreductase